LKRLVIRCQQFHKSSIWSNSMTELSPTAQAVRDAAFDLWETVDTAEAIAAASLRAVADQVVPQEGPPADFLDVQVAAEIDQRLATRSQLLAIADELEAQ
jgi:hypothetical protein